VTWQLCQLKEGSLAIDLTTDARGIEVNSMFAARSSRLGLVLRELINRLAEAPLPYRLLARREKP